MPAYMFQVSYTHEGWSAYLENPVDRATVLQGTVEKLGGTLLQFFYSFDEYDFVAIADFPSNVDAASLRIRATAHPAVRYLKLTALMSTADASEAMKRSQPT